MSVNRNQVWYLLENLFHAFNITVVPREMNKKTDSLDIPASKFKATVDPRIENEVEMIYRSSIQDNHKHWQVFEDDQKIKIFLEIISEFSTTYMDQYQTEDEGEECQ